MFDNLDNLRKEKDRPVLSHRPTVVVDPKVKGINFLPEGSVARKGGLFALFQKKEKTTLHVPEKIKPVKKEASNEQQKSFFARLLSFFSAPKKEKNHEPIPLAGSKILPSQKFNELLFTDDLKSNLPKPNVKTEAPKVSPLVTASAPTSPKPPAVPVSPPPPNSKPKVEFTPEPVALAQQKVVEPKMTFSPRSPIIKELPQAEAKPIVNIKAEEAEKNLGEHEVKNNEDKDEELSVNLLPGKKFFLSDKQIIWTYVFIFFLGALAIGSPYNYYRLKNKQATAQNKIFTDQLTQIDAKNKELNKQIADYGPLAKKIKQLLPLLDNHVYFSQFFPILEKYTVRNVYFSSLDISAEGLISLTGNAWQLRDLAEQLIVFEKNSSFTELKLDSLTFLKPELPTDPAVSFTVSFLLDPKILSANYLTE